MKVRNNGTIINPVEFLAQIPNQDSRRYTLLELVGPMKLCTENTDTNKQGINDLFVKSKFGEKLLFKMCREGAGNERVELFYYSEETEDESEKTMVTEIKRDPAERLMVDKEGRWVAVITPKWRTLKVAIWELK